MAGVVSTQDMRVTEVRSEVVQYAMADLCWVANNLERSRVTSFGH